MGYKRKQARAARKAAATAAPEAARNTPGMSLADPRLADTFAAPPPGVRVPITEDNALTLSAVWSATRVITGAVSILPLCVYRRKPNDDREEVAEPGEGGLVAGFDVTAAAKLTCDPCPEVGAITFWETMVGHALNRGNGYAEIEEDQAGNPIALWLLPPHPFTRPVRDPKTKALSYESFQAGFGAANIPARNVFHLAGLGFDGLQGYSVITMARRSLGLAATSEQAGESFFGNGMRPGGWVEFPGTLQELQKVNAEEGIKEKHAGAGKFGKALLLWGGMKYHPLEISPEDAQFLETRQFQVEEVARWYNVPPHKLKHLLRATFSNIEHQGSEFVTDTLLYWLGKVAEEFRRKLLSRYGPGYYAEHTTERLQRGDTIARYTAYGLGRQWGFLSPNDVRRKENLPPIPKGDVYHVPVNMSPIGSEPGAAGGGDKPSEPPPAAAATAELVALDVARDAGRADAVDLERLAAAAAGEDTELLAVYAERAVLSDWYRPELAADVRLRTVGRLLGREVDGFAVASGVAALRVAGLRPVAAADDPAFAARELAARWRSDVAEVVAIILGRTG